MYYKNMITKIILISTCTLVMSSNTKSGYISDPNDTTSWNNAYVLSADTTYNAILKDSDDEDFSRNNITDHDATVVTSWFFGTTHKFNCTYGNILKTVSTYGPSGLYSTYLSIVQTCINLIGCTFGLTFSTKKQNFMYHPVSSSTIFPYNNIGDGDVSSYLYIYG